MVFVATFLRTQWMMAFSSLVKGVSTFMLSAAFLPRGFFLSAMTTYDLSLLSKEVSLIAQSSWVPYANMYG